MSPVPAIDEACFYTVLRSPRENHEQLLREFVTPVVRDIREHPDLHSFFFVRYNEPDWQLRFRVLGRPEWVEGSVRRRIESALPSLLDSGIVEGVDFGEYQREWERYGGQEGMRLAERIFLHDSAACLDLIQAEARGELARSRREYSLVHTERLLDILGFGRGQRLAFHQRGYQWAITEGHWTEEDLVRLEDRYSTLREGLRDLLEGASSGNPALQLGGAEPARISSACIEATRPVVETLLEAHAQGKIAQDLGTLAWSYAHMHCNRLGIDTAAEAILRFFMFRFYTES